VDAFPRPRCAKRQEYISCETLDVVAQRGKVLKAFNDTGRKMRFAVVWFSFAVWRSQTRSARRVGTRAPRFCWTRGAVSRKLCVKRVRLSVVLDELTRRTSMLVAADYAKFVASKADALVDASLR
jgi:hypothetical protein